VLFCKKKIASKSTQPTTVIYIAHIDNSDCLASPSREAKAAIQNLDATKVVSSKLHETVAEMREG
jgi:hypothetical protein